MNKTKFLTTAVVVMVLLNIGTLVFIVIGPPPHPPKPDPRHVIIERLHLDQKQIEQFQILIDQHRHQTRRIEEQIMDEKDHLFRLLATNDTLMLRTVLDGLGRLHRQKDSLSVDHFLAIKKICRHDQLMYFSDLTKDLAQLFRPVSRKREDQPGD